MINLVDIINELFFYEIISLSIILK